MVRFDGVTPEYDRLDVGFGSKNEPARAGEGGTRLAACLRLVTKMIKDG